MDYITISEASEKWNIDISRIGRLLREGKLQGIRVGKHWLIPKDAQRPVDRRTRSGKAASMNSRAGKAPFRYPRFEGIPDASIDPPLSSEELLLKRSGEAFHACRFKESEALITELLQRKPDKHMRIFALYEACMVSMMLNRGREFFDLYSKLISEFTEDFPQKSELSVLPHEINACIGSVSYFINEYKVEPAYSYNSSYLTHLAELTVVSYYYSERTELTPAVLSSFELTCILFENTEYPVDLQAIHLYLGVLYSFSNDPEKAAFHYRKGLLMADKYELLWLPALLIYYYRSSFLPVLNEFSNAFKDKLIRLSDEIHERYCKFMNETSMNNIYVLLSSRDHIFPVFAANGFLNKEIAHIMHISEKTVGKRYSEIYEKLGVKNKRELVRFYRHSLNNDPESSRRR